MNNLKGANLVIYHYLQSKNLPRTISYGEIAHNTYYHIRTICRAVQALENKNLISRHRESIGQAYIYQLKELK